MDCHNYCFLQPRYLLYTVTKKNMMIMIMIDVLTSLKIQTHTSFVYIIMQRYSFLLKGKTSVGRKSLRVSACRKYHFVTSFVGRRKEGTPGRHKPQAMQIRSSHICIKRASTMQHSFLKILIIICNKKC